MRRSPCARYRAPCRRPESRRPRRLAALRLSRLNPIAADVTGRRAAGRPPGDAALVLPDSGRRRAARPGPRDRAHTLAHLPGARRALRRTGAARSRTATPARGHRSASRWSTRRTARFPTSRASTPAPSSWSARSGVEVVSSGDLVQRFAAVWDDAAIATHRAASEKLYRVKDRAFEAIAQRTARRRRRRPNTTFSS